MIARFQHIAQDSHDVGRLVIARARDTRLALLDVRHLAFRLVLKGPAHYLAGILDHAQLMIFTRYGHVWRQLIAILFSGSSDLISRFILRHEGVEVVEDLTVSLVSRAHIHVDDGYLILRYGGGTLRHLQQVIAIVGLDQRRLVDGGAENFTVEVLAKVGLGERGLGKPTQIATILGRSEGGVLLGQLGKVGAALEQRHEAVGQSG